MVYQFSYGCLRGAGLTLDAVRLPSGTTVSHVAVPGEPRVPSGRFVELLRAMNESAACLPAGSRHADPGRPAQAHRAVHADHLRGATPADRRRPVSVVGHNSGRPGPNAESTPPTPTRPWPPSRCVTSAPAARRPGRRLCDLTGEVRGRVESGRLPPDRPAGRPRRRGGPAERRGRRAGQRIRQVQLGVAGSFARTGPSTTSTCPASGAPGWSGAPAGSAPTGRRQRRQPGRGRRTAARLGATPTASPCSGSARRASDWHRHGRHPHARRARRCGRDRLHAAVRAGLDPQQDRPAGPGRWRGRAGPGPRARHPRRDASPEVVSYAGERRAEYAV